MDEPITLNPVPDPEYLAPFETYKLATSSAMVVYRGTIRAEFAQNRAELHRLLGLAPGEHHVEEIDGRLYATICIYRTARPKNRLWLHILLFLLTALTVVAAGAEMAKLDWGGIMLIPIRFVAGAAVSLADGALRQFLEWNLPQFLGEMSEGLQYAAAILVILLSHEMGHYLMARRHGVNATLPFLIPAPFFFGTMGALIRMRSPIIHRRALFDIGVAGPIAGLLASVVVCAIGLHIAQPAQAMPSTGGEIMVFSEPPLFRGMVALFAPPMNGAEVSLNPLMLAGWFGLFLTFLNLMPIGQLDGGHMWYALIGRRQKYVGWAAMAAIAGMAIFVFQGWIGMIVLILILLRVKHPPVLDESVRLDRPRVIIGILLILIFLMLFMPVPIEIYEVH